ncbi:MAG: 30S ribosome-binding factor RbfA [Gammaproteobacteria bacterium]
MAREFTRSRRVEEQIQRLLADVFRTEIRDPRVADVVDPQVKASRDRSVAWIQYGLLDTGAEANEETLAEVQSGLESAAGYIRTRLASEMSTRTVPELRFKFDDGPQRRRDLERLIDAAVAADANNNPDSDADSDPDTSGKL